MHLIVGLGNPGPRYAMTRHNAGFLFLDFLASAHGFSFAGTARWQAQLAKIALWDQSLVLAKPETFMNRSGEAVAGVLNYYRISPDNMVVIHDDLDLPVGRTKIVAGGGAGGHNGIRSIIASLGNSDFPRIKVGIGRPPIHFTGADYVLSSLSPEERETLNDQFPLMEEGLRLLLEKGLAAAMNLVNSK